MPGERAMVGSRITCRGPAAPAAPAGPAGPIKDDAGAAWCRRRCGTGRLSTCAGRADIWDQGCLRGHHLEERRGPPEDLPDDVTRQLILVRPMPRHLPHL